MFPLFDKTTIQALTEDLNSQKEHLHAIFENIKVAMQEMANTLNKLPPSIKTLSDSGWYIPLFIDTTTINVYAHKLKQGDITIVDIGMKALLDDNMNIIEREILEAFPNRKAALSSALRAHKANDYYLSIPVFFSQIEGICKDITGFRFFSVLKNEAKTKKWVENFVEGSFTEILLEPLKHVNKFRQVQDPQQPNGINRHDVLHGDSLDYGEDSINSYKALSLLFYFAETVKDANNDLADE